jgi:septal ring factor EnvC (AmiA/AmiB activator)
VNGAPSQTETLQLEESHPEDSQYQLSDLEDKQVAFLVENKSLTPAAQQALHKVLDQKNQVDAIETQIKARRQEQESIAKDQARMRENMKALKGSAEEKSLLQRYTRQLDSQEDRLNTLQKQISDLQERKEKAEAEFARRSSRSVWTKRSKWVTECPERVAFERRRAICTPTPEGRDQQLKSSALGQFCLVGVCKPCGLIPPNFWLIEMSVLFG